MKEAALLTIVEQALYSLWRGKAAGWGCRGRAWCPPTARTSGTVYSGVAVCTGGGDGVGPGVHLRPTLL
eukprot:6707752-Karenia_brevis.AAC.1